MKLKIALTFVIGMLLLIAACSKDDQPSRSLVPFNGQSILQQNLNEDSIFNLNEYSSSVSEGNRLMTNIGPDERIPTGLSSETNKEIVVTVKQVAGSRLPTLVIGTSGLDVPNTVQYVPLISGENKITAKIAGLLWLVYANDAPNSKAHLVFESGFKRAPIFMMGKTLNAQWKEQLSQKNVTKDAILMSGRVVVAVPTDRAIQSQNENQDSVLKGIEHIIDREDYISGLDGLTDADKVSPLMYIYTQLPGLPPSTYDNGAITFPPESLLTLLALSTIKNDGWGLAHETGHKHQQRWSWAVTTEVTVNIYTMVLNREAFPYNNALTNIWPIVTKYLALPDAARNYNDDKLQYTATVGGWTQLLMMRLAMFEQLHIEFGDLFYIKLHKKTRLEKPNLKTDNDKMSYFIRNSCEISQTNLVTFFQKWGLKLSTSDSTATLFKEIEGKGYKAESRDLTLLTD